MTLTDFYTDFYTVALNPRPRSGHRTAMIIIHYTGRTFRADFVRAPKSKHVANTWRAFAVIGGERIETEGRTQISAAIALALAIGKVLYGMDFEAEQADHDRLSRIDPSPSMEEQDRECEAEQLARMLDRA